MPQRDQRIGFRIVSCGAAGWYIVRHDFELPRVAAFGTEVTGQIDPITGAETEPPDVVFVHENDMTATGDTAIPIGLAVDGGVELVMAADGHHQQLIAFEIPMWNRMDGENGSTRFGWKFLLIARRVREIETATLADPLIVILEAGHHLFDVVANAIVIGTQAEPIDAGSAAERSCRDVTNDCGFAHEVRAGGREDAATFLDDAHRVFAADELLAGALHVFFGSS